MNIAGSIRKWKIKAGVFVLFAILCTGFLAMETMACVKVRNTEWEGKGKVEVHFQSCVQYRNACVTVKDADGKKHKTTIVEYGNSEIEFKTAGLKQGARYTFTICGIRKKGCSSYGSVKGSFKVPKTVHGITMKETDLDLSKRLVSFEFLEMVQWKKAKVSISDGKKEYVLKIQKKSRKEIEVKVKQLKAGKRYKWTISGIRRKGWNKYVTLTGYFKAA